MVKPLLDRKYNAIKIWKYAQKKPKKTNNFLKSIKAMKADYIYVADINSEPCVTAKKQRIKHRNIDKDSIIVVIKEIESWYLAGLDNTNSNQFGIGTLSTTDDITKEQFNDLIPEAFDSRIDFMQEILSSFNPETAKKKNKSFKYFIGKHGCNTKLSPAR